MSDIHEKDVEHFIKSIAYPDQAATGHDDKGSSAVLFRDREFTLASSSVVGERERAIPQQRVRR